MKSDAEFVLGLEGEQRRLLDICIQIETLLNSGNQCTLAKIELFGSALALMALTQRYINAKQANAEAEAKTAKTYACQMVEFFQKRTGKIIDEYAVQVAPVLRILQLSGVFRVIPDELRVDSKA